MTNFGNANKRIGIWIDHKEAFLVSLEGDEAKVERIASDADSNVRAKGGYKAGGTSVAQSVMKEQSSEERRKHQLKDFYTDVLDAASRADSIYIFGPGGAKNEFVKEFGNNHRDKIKAVETSDSMTENQIVAKVKSFFSVSEERFKP